MYDVTALGEALIDYTPAGLSENGMPLFEQNPGGAPANVLACVSKLGLKTAFLGKVGADMQGDFIRDTLKSAGIEIRGLISDSQVFTTLAFVSLDSRGERSFSFARKPGADTCLRPEELKLPLIETCRIFHFGSLSLTDSPAREATIFALDTAKKAGCLISYDPNYRPLLWESREQAVLQLRSVLPYADLVKISDEEAALVTGCAQPEKAALSLLKGGAKLLAVTLGKSGALVASSSGCVTVPGFAVRAVDTTGAGDAFWGAFLFALLQLGKAPEACTPDELYTLGRFANAAAALCITKTGAIPALPTLGEIQALLHAQR